jgi:hypothetical protein
MIQHQGSLVPGGVIRQLQHHGQQGPFLGISVFARNDMCDQIEPRIIKDQGLSGQGGGPVRPQFENPMFDPGQVIAVQAPGLTQMQDLLREFKENGGRQLYLSGGLEFFTSTFAEGAFRAAAHVWQRSRSS